MPDFLSFYAQSQPDKMAVVDDRPDGSVTSLTWAELEARSNQLANVPAHGAGPGSKVVWCGQNSIPVVVMVNAARKAGTTAVPLNYRLSDEEAAYVVDHCDATVAFVDADVAPMFGRIKADIPKVSTVLVYGGDVPEGMADAEALMAEAPTAEPAPVEPGATMIYTSGTTGKPKGALRTGAGDPAQVEAMIALIGYTPDDVIPTGPPTTRVRRLHGHCARPSARPSSSSVARSGGLAAPVDRYHHLDVLGPHADPGWSAPARGGEGPLRPLVDEADGGQRRPVVVRPQAAVPHRLPRTARGYGSTELGVNCILEPNQLRKPGSCGRPAPAVEVCLFDDDGNVVDGIGPDHPGELFVRSPSVFADYYKQHDRYLADNRDGWQTVGDIAYWDDEGFLYICDRKKDMIISGGMNIYPAEIEAELELHPDIYEVAVFGIPNEEWGEAVHATVAARLVRHRRRHRARARAVPASHKTPPGV
jgi:fatty-acyl-CoA synthase/long-chain acyl-CoA synthetase